MTINNFKIRFNINKNKYKSFNELVNKYRIKWIFFMKRNFPKLYTIIFSSKKDIYRPQRRIFCLFLGFIVSHIIYYFIIKRFTLTPDIKRFVFITTLTLITIGYTFSIQIRAILCLVIPTFLGRTGRNFFIILSFSLFINGPIKNIIDNSFEASRSLTCTFRYNEKLIKDRIKLIFEPVKNIILGYGKSNAKISKKISKIKDTFSPISKEILDNSEEDTVIKDIKETDEIIGANSRIEQVENDYNKMAVTDKSFHKYAAKYARKMDLKCEDIFSHALKRCFQAFESAEKWCQTTVILTPICIVFKIKVICSLASNLITKRSCKSSEQSSSRFGQAFEEAKLAFDQIETEFSTRAKYRFYRPEILPNVSDVLEIENNLRNTVRHYKNLFDFAINITLRLVTYMFLLIFISSARYHNKYLNDLSHDNIYITTYFRHIDYRRKKNGKDTLLPLKELEKKELIELLTLKLSSYESKQFKISLIILLSIAITFTFAIIFDYIFIGVLKIVNEHAYLNVTINSLHSLELRVNGTGLFARIVKSILHDFSEKTSIKAYYSNEKCLPIPKKTNSSTIIIIYMSILLAICFNYIQVHTARLRHHICAFFYPKRERKRILYLYNDRLRKRRNYVNYKIHQIRRIGREKSLSLDDNILSALVHGYNIRFLKKWFKRKCIICDSKEKPNFISCANPNCNLLYCHGCWKISGFECHICAPIQSDDSDSE